MGVNIATGVAKSTEVINNQATNISDKKIYVNNSTGKVITTINTAESEKYTEYDPDELISVSLPVLITSGNKNAIGDNNGEQVTMTVAQYRDYQNQVEKKFKILFDNSTKEEKNTLIFKAFETIVDIIVNGLRI